MKPNDQRLCEEIELNMVKYVSQPWPPAENLTGVWISRRKLVHRPCYLPSSHISKWRTLVEIKKYTFWGKREWIRQKAQHRL